MQSAERNVIQVRQGHIYGVFLLIPPKKTTVSFPSATVAGVFAFQFVLLLMCHFTHVHVRKQVKQAWKWVNCSKLWPHFCISVSYSDSLICLLVIGKKVGFVILVCLMYDWCWTLMIREVHPCLCQWCLPRKKHYRQKEASSPVWHVSITAGLSCSWYKVNLWLYSEWKAIITFPLKIKARC